MEAPEMVYLTQTEDGTSYYTERIPFERDDYIEYVCADAFIEKAVRWLKKELPITDLSPSNMLDITFKVFDKECKKEFIEKFKKYMEK